MYSHTSVTINAKASYHSMYLGAPARAPDSMSEKSRTRLSAAMTTTTTLTVPLGLRIARTPTPTSRNLEARLISALITATK